MEDWQIAELKATGIDVEALFKVRSQAWVKEQIRFYWPVPAGKPNARCLPVLGSDEYYENIAAAAMTGDVGFTSIFWNRRTEDTTPDQMRELKRYIQGDFTAPHWRIGEMDPNHTDRDAQLRVQKSEWSQKA